MYSALIPCAQGLACPGTNRLWCFLPVNSVLPALCEQCIIVFITLQYVSSQVFTAGDIPIYCNFPYLEDRCFNPCYLNQKYCQMNTNIVLFILPPDKRPCPQEKPCIQVGGRCINMNVEQCKITEVSFPQWCPSRPVCTCCKGKCICVFTTLESSNCRS